MGSHEAMIDTLIERSATRGARWEASRALYELLLDVAGWDRGWIDPELEARTALASGEAIAPFEAAVCLFDELRTFAFALGVVEAVAGRLRAHRAGPVVVLYAGCGPFATLLLPAFRRFPPEQLQCVLLDVHPRALEAAGRVLAALGMERFVRRIELADAATYRIPDGDVGVVVSECLRRGLTAEPQVSITWNLISQLPPDVALVPEEIRLELVAGEVGESTMGPARPMRDLGRVFTFGPDAARAWGPYSPRAVSVPAGSVVLDDAVIPPDRLAVATELRTFGDVWLGRDESTLTLPVAVDVAVPLEAGTRLDFEYRLDLPGLAPARPPA